jgi:hypothetical protein
MNYGTKIDYYNSEEEKVYNIFTDYFNNPVLTKVNDDNFYSTYASKSGNSMMNIYKRYLIVIVLKDNKQLGNKENLSNLKWRSLQTRTFNKEYDTDITNFEHTPSTQPHYEIALKDRGEKYCIYTCLNLPIYVTLLLENWEDKQSTLRYQSKGTLSQAIETWKTSISFA